MRRGVVISLVLLIALGSIVQLRSIRSFPNFSATDEAIIFNYIDTWKATGRVAISLMPTPTATLTGNLYVYASASWAALFPGDAFALRHFSAIGGLLLVGVVFLAGRALHDSLTGLLAAALLTTNLLWLAASHVGRQEIWLAVFVWFAFWLSLTSQKRNSPAPALFGGLVAALSADVHPLGAYACIALGAWWLARRRSRHLLLAFISGGLLGTAYYFAAHVLPDANGFLGALRGELTSYGAEGWNPVEAMIARHLNYLRSNPLELLLVFSGSTWTLLRHKGRGLGIFLGVLVLFYTLTVADPNPYYPIVWITGLVILLAISLRRTRRSRLLLALGIGISFLINIGLVEQFVHADWNQRTLSAMRMAAEYVPESGRGLGESFFFLALRETQPESALSFSGFTYVYFEALKRGSTYEEIVTEIAPDWIVTMADAAPFVPPLHAMSVDMPNMRLALSEVILGGEYQLAERILTESGMFEIWRRV